MMEQKMMEQQKMEQDRMEQTTEHIGDITTSILVKAPNPFLKP